MLPGAQAVKDRVALTAFGWSRGSVAIRTAADAVDPAPERRDADHGFPSSLKIAFGQAPLCLVFVGVCWLRLRR